MFRCYAVAVPVIRLFKTQSLIVLVLFLIGACGGGGSTSTLTIPFGTKQLGVSGAITSASSVTTDASGNVYVAGVTYGNLDGNNLAGTNDFFLTRYNTNGTKVYTRQLGTTGADTFGGSVATDANGNVYVTGFTKGGLDGNSLTGTYDFFLTKYDVNGIKIFTRQLGAVGVATIGNSVATDASGNVYVAGYTYGSLDGNTLVGNADFFLTKFDATGTKKYTKQMGVAGANTFGNSVAIDFSGGVYVAGYTSGGLDGNTLTGTGDFFVTKYDAAGAKIYTRQLGVVWVGTFGTSVATDAAANVYVTGYTYGGLDSNTQTGTVDFFLTKYDAAGVKQYTKQMGAAGTNTDTSGYSVATDTTGNVYVSGYTSGSLGGNPQTGNYDFFLTKYDATGAWKFTKQKGVTGGETSSGAVATDAGNNIYVAGSTNKGLDGNTLSGTMDFFLTRYSAAGNKN